MSSQKAKRIGPASMSLVNEEFDQSILVVVLEWYWQNSSLDIYRRAPFSHENDETNKINNTDSWSRFPFIFSRLQTW